MIWLHSFFGRKKSGMVFTTPLEFHLENFIVLKLISKLQVQVLAVTFCKIEPGDPYGLMARDLQ